MVAQTFVGHEEAIVVRAGGAILYGISGHKIAEVEGKSSVTTYGEHGPYTIVSWQGRNGYVLTECLVTAGDLAQEEAAAVAAAEPAAVEQEEAAKSGKSRVLVLLLLVAGAGGAASVALGLL